MEVLERYSENMVAQFKRNPLATYISRYAYVRTRYASADPIADSLAKSAGVHAAEEMTEKAIQHNNRIDDVYAAEALMYAQRLDALGTFKCVGKTPDQTWAASVLPVYLEASVREQFVASSLRMAIKVHKLSSDPRPEKSKEMGLP